MRVLLTMFFIFIFISHCKSRDEENLPSGTEEEASAQNDSAENYVVDVFYVKDDNVHRKTCVFKDLADAEKAKANHETCKHMKPEQSLTSGQKPEAYSQYISWIESADIPWMNMENFRNAVAAMYQREVAEMEEDKQNLVQERNQARQVIASSKSADEAKKLKTTYDVDYLEIQIKDIENEIELQKQLFENAFLDIQQRLKEPGGFAYDYTAKLPTEITPTESILLGYFNEILQRNITN